MNENKFLRNLSQQSNPLPASSSRAVEPTSPQPARRTDNTPTEYDPIKRLTDELSRHSRAIEGLNTRIDRLEGRPQAATQAELQALLHEAREGVNFTIDSESIAGLMLPELKKGMPTPAGIKAAADAGASTITAAGNAAAAQIERAGSEAADRIRWASQSKADVFAGRVGFTSWQAAAVVFLGFALLIVGVYWLNSNREAALAQARSETQGVREFTNWVKTQPEGKRLYDRYYNP
jgi:cell division septum initiation protein DivIVA